MLDFTPTIERDAERRARTTELVKRDRELGGTVPSDRDAENIARAVKAWLAPYRSEVTRAELRAAESGEPITDYRTITVGRLQLDVRRAVKRWSATRKADTPIIEARALMLLIQWPEHGSTPTRDHPRAELTDLGGRNAERRARRIARMEESTPARQALRVIAELERMLRVGTLPERRVWQDAERRDRDGRPMLTRGALRALRAAVKQATDDLRAELETRELPAGETLDFSELVDAERETVSVERLPRVDMPETVARLMDVPLDAARALVARAWPESLDELAEQWSLSRASLDVALSRGRVKLRDRYPSATELYDALDALSDVYRAELERTATVELLSYALRPETDAHALSAVLAWRDAQRYLPDAERAELNAARAALQRAQRGLSPERRAELAERIAGSSRRLMSAERARAKRGMRMRPSAELARTYPGASWHVADGTVNVTPAPTRRAELPARALAALAERRAELRALLDYGSADADRIRTLRAELRAA